MNTQDSIVFNNALNNIMTAAQSTGNSELAAMISYQLGLIKEISDKQQATIEGLIAECAQKTA